MQMGEEGMQNGFLSCLAISFREPQWIEIGKFVQRSILQLEQSSIYFYD